jgi:hypothetical protein
MDCKKSQWLTENGFKETGVPAIDVRRETNLKMQ